MIIACHWKILCVCGRGGGGGGRASMAQWMTTNGVIKVSPLYKYSRTSL